MFAMNVELNSEMGMLGLNHNYRLSNISISNRFGQQWNEISH